jgi:hypothetical protein
VVTLNANNGDSPVVATTVIQVDDPITNLLLKYEPEDPAVGEGMIFIVTTDDTSRHIDVSLVISLKKEMQTSVTYSIELELTNKYFDLVELSKKR